MEKVKKAQAGVGLKRRQYKRLGRIAERNTERAKEVAERMKERATRYQRGKELAGDDAGARVRKSMEEAREASKTASKAKNGKSFPDLNKDGKITQADILKGRGVIKNGGKIKKAQAGLKASNKRVGPVDPKGAWTKVQEMNLPPRNVKTSVSLKKDKQLGATKMKSGGKMKKK
jgi:multidrug efflux pump subunit AcrA (membrane-fusion protein)